MSQWLKILFVMQINAQSKKAACLYALLALFSFFSHLSFSQNETNDTYIKMYHQMQFMQEELMRMQGKIEHLENDLKKLKKQQLDDYVGLDKRIRGLKPTPSAISTPPIKKSAQGKPIDIPVNKTIPKVKSDTAPSKPTVAAPKKPEIEKGEQYKAAYTLIKEKKFDEAKLAFLAFIKDHPKDRLVANCYYWLGELYILEGSLNESEKMFNKIVADFPDHPKKPEAMYKLGRLYFDRGDKEEAKRQMQRVVDTYKGQNINAVKLAKDFLDKHFS